jgi:hemoglobin-like flavoprotein
MANEAPISESQIALVKETWLKVVPIADIASGLFYDRLFEINPELRSMFDGVDFPQQRKKLIQAINMVVMSLDKINTLIPTIKALGNRHVGYGVEDHHYAQVGDALLWTLETGLSDDWTHDAKVAWTTAYQLLTSVMIEGANEELRSVA